MDDEAGRFLEAIEVANLALVAALAEQVGSLAIGAALRPPESSLKLDMDRGGSRLSVLKGVVTLQAYI